MYEYLTSLWRTVVPLLVSAIGGQLARIGLHIDDAALSLWLGAAFGAVYYAAFRWAEHRISPRFGWLLGLARPPKYTGARE